MTRLPQSLGSTLVLWLDQEMSYVSIRVLRNHPFKWVCRHYLDDLGFDLILGRFELDLSIFRARPGSGRTEKISVIAGRKNPAHAHPTGRIGPQFSGRAPAGAGRPRIL
jgi:hypothetical protein